MFKLLLRVYEWLTRPWLVIAGLVFLSISYLLMAFYPFIQGILPSWTVRFFEILYFNAIVMMFYIMMWIYLLASLFQRWPQSRKLYHNYFKPLASLKLAVVIILAIAALIAGGTIIESKFNDAKAAAAYVYHTPWMLGVLLLLCLNLIGVMVDRLPWQRRHVGFIFAHIGIILTLLGALETSRKGVDGSLAFGIGETNRFVSLSETEIVLHSSFDGLRYTQIFHQPVDIFSRNFKSNPIRIPTLNKDFIEVIDSMKYAAGSQKVVESDSSRDGVGIRFQLAGPMASSTEWILQKRPSEEAIFSLGPARLSYRLVEPLSSQGFNEIVFLRTDSPDQLRYVVFNKNSEKPAKKGFIKEGEQFDVGWMGFHLRLLRYLPKAKSVWEFKSLEQSTPMTTSAVKVRYKGEEQWVQLNDVLKFFGEEAVYIFTFGNRRLDLGFNLKLDHFEVGRYQGTMRAATYESTVSVENLGTVKISMNEPLKHQGYTFYQASFNEDEMGRPTASILSVNKDTGRFAKYLGCILIVLGSILMFYFKHIGKKRGVVK